MKVYAEKDLKQEQDTWCLLSPCHSWASCCPSSRWCTPAAPLRCSPPDSNHHHDDHDQDDDDDVPHHALQLDGGAQVVEDLVLHLLVPLVHYLDGRNWKVSKASRSWRYELKSIKKYQDLDGRKWKVSSSFASRVSNRESTSSSLILEPMCTGRS